MKTKNLIATCGLVLATLTGAGTAAAAPVVSFTPASSHIEVGESVFVTVTISGLGAEVLSAYDLNFIYNAALLNWDSLTVNSGPFKVNFDPIVVFDNEVEGDLGFLANSLDSDADLAANQPNSFELLSFTLRGIADGVATFTLGPDADFDRNFVGLNALSLQVTVGGACIAVGTGVCATTPVPEPSTLVLIAFAIAGVLLPASRRRRGGLACG